MTQLQYNIIDSKKINGHSIPIFSKLPNQFKKSWIQITRMSLSNTKYVASLYFNDEQKPGTVIVSDFITSSYPDIYVTFDLENNADRLYINPLMRKNGYLHIVGLILRACFYNYLNGEIVNGSKDRHAAANKAYIQAKSILNEQPEPNNPTDNLSANSRYNIEPPRDPIFPNVWQGHRIGGRNG